MEHGRSFRVNRRDHRDRRRHAISLTRLAEGGEKQLIRCNRHAEAEGHASAELRELDDSKHYSSDVKTYQRIPMMGWKQSEIIGRRTPMNDVNLARLATLPAEDHAWPSCASWRPQPWKSPVWLFSSVTRWRDRQRRIHRTRLPVDRFLVLACAHESGQRPVDQPIDQFGWSIRTAKVAGILAEATWKVTWIVRSSTSLGPRSRHSIFAVITPFPLRSARHGGVRLTSGIIICLMIDRSTMIDRDFPRSNTAVPVVGRSGRSTDESVRGTHRRTGSFYCDGYTRCRYQNADICNDRSVHASLSRRALRSPLQQTGEIRQSRAWSPLSFNDTRFAYRIFLSLSLSRSLALSRYGYPW